MQLNEHTGAKHGSQLTHGTYRNGGVEVLQPPGDVQEPANNVSRRLAGAHIVLDAAPGHELKHRAQTVGPHVEPLAAVHELEISADVHNSDDVCVDGQH